MKEERTFRWKSKQLHTCLYRKEKRTIEEHVCNEKTPKEIKALSIDMYEGGKNIQTEK